MEDDILINDHILNYDQKTNHTLLWSYGNDYSVKLGENDVSEQWKGDFKQRDQKSKKTKESLINNNDTSYVNAIQTLYNESEKLANSFIEKELVYVKNDKKKKDIKLHGDINFIFPVLACIFAFLGIYLIFKYHI